MRIPAAALMAAFFMAAPAAAQLYPRTLQVPCSGPGILPQLLAGDYGEAVAGQGVSDGTLVQLWRNSETGTWTILAIVPDGPVCALTSGEDWMDAERPPPARL
jgi:hypothetical protein